MMRKNMLFVCDKNGPRSKTAEVLFFENMDINTKSAGLSPDSEQPLSHPRIRWADIVFVMDQAEADAVRAKFSKSLADKPLVVLDIPDDFIYLQQALVALLQKRVGPYVP
jgi:predicted protein tyrosine phosphatase